MTEGLGLGSHAKARRVALPLPGLGRVFRAATRRDGALFKGSAEARRDRDGIVRVDAPYVRSAAVLAILLRLRAQEPTFKIRRSRLGHL